MTYIGRHHWPYRYWLSFYISSKIMVQYKLSCGSALKGIWLVMINKLMCVFEYRLQHLERKCDWTKIQKLDRIICNPLIHIVVSVFRRYARILHKMFQTLMYGICNWMHTTDYYIPVLDKLWLSKKSGTSSLILACSYLDKSVTEPVLSNNSTL